MTGSRDYWKLTPLYLPNIPFGSPYNPGEAWTINEGQTTRIPHASYYHPIDVSAAGFMIHGKRADQFDWFGYSGSQWRAMVASVQDQIFEAIKTDFPQSFLRELPWEGNAGLYPEAAYNDMDHCIDLVWGNTTSGKKLMSSFGLSFSTSKEGQYHKPVRSHEAFIQTYLPTTRCFGPPGPGGDRFQQYDFVIRKMSSGAEFRLTSQNNSNAYVRDYEPGFPWGTSVLFGNIQRFIGYVATHPRDGVMFFLKPSLGTYESNYRFGTEDDPAYYISGPTTSIYRLHYMPSPFGAGLEAAIDWDGWSCLAQTYSDRIYFQADMVQSGATPRLDVRFNGNSSNDMTFLRSSTDPGYNWNSIMLNTLENQRDHEISKLIDHLHHPIYRSTYNLSGHRLSVIVFDGAATAGFRGDVSPNHNDLDGYTNSTAWGDKVGMTRYQRNPYWPEYEDKWDGRSNWIYDTSNKWFSPYSYYHDRWIVNDSEGRDFLFDMGLQLAFALEPGLDFVADFVNRNAYGHANFG